MYIELVEGLGETLVGNSPGSAHRFSVSKQKLGSDPTAAAPESIQIEGLSSKSEALLADQGSLIFRSDSNGEDLAG